MNKFDPDNSWRPVCRQSKAMADEARETTIGEELVDMLMKDDTGLVAAIPEWRMSCLLVGAVLLDLSFSGRIDIDLRALQMNDPTPTLEELPDPRLVTTAGEADAHSTRYWVERLAPKADDIIELVFERVVRREILEQDTAGFRSLSGKIVRSSARSLGLWQSSHAGVLQAGQADGQCLDRILQRQPSRRVLERSLVQRFDRRQGDAASLESRL